VRWHRNDDRVGIDVVQRLDAIVVKLGVDPVRALHVGDDPVHDEQAARKAGLHFAPAPLAAAVEQLA